MLSKNFRFGFCAMLSACLLSVAMGFESHANTINVTTSDDELNADGDCSLREAIQAANTNAPVSGCDAGDAAPTVDVIVLPANTYTLNLNVTGDDANQEGDLDILESVTINGAGAVNTIIANGYGAAALGDGDRIFHIDPGAAVGAVDVTITNVTIRDGDVGCAAANCTTGGGAIYKQSTGFLTIEDSFLLENHVSCSVANCGDADNTAVLLISNGGNLTLRRVTISSNTASCTGSGCEGGSLVLRMNGNSGNLVIESSTITSNTASCTTSACGVSNLLFDEVTAGNAMITNTTISGNSITCNGFDCDTDELIELDGLNPITMTSLTISNNTLGCTGDACGSDEILSITGAGNRSLISSQINDNTQSCVGDFDAGATVDNQFCDVGQLINMGDGTLTLTNTRIRDNDASCDGSDCGVAPRVTTDGADFTLQNTTFSGNTSRCIGTDCFGGALVKNDNTGNAGNLVMEGTQVSDNTISCSSTGCEIAEVFEYETDGNVTVSATTFSNNEISCTATGCDGEELIEFDDSNDVNITTLTVTGNRVFCTADACDADEVFSVSGANSLTLSDSTITNNTSSCTGAPSAGQECDIDPLFFTPGTGTVVITNLTLSGNSLSCTGDACGSDSLGPGVYGLMFMVDANVTLRDSQIVDNTLSCVGDFSAAVGSVCIVGPRLFLGELLGPSLPVTIDNTTIARNRASCQGLGCLVTATVDLSVTTASSITATTIDANTATCSGTNCGSHVAGVRLNGDSTLMVRTTTISNNVNACPDTGLCSPFQGGGLTVGPFFPPVASLTVVNSTISGNHTNGHGGGLLHLGDLFGPTGQVSLNNVTIANNVADADNNGTGDGGGIYHDDANNAGTLNFQNTLIANNSDPTSDPDCFGTLNSLGFNLIQTPSANCTISGTTTGNLISFSALLAPLADNGGPTLTHGLLPNSPALNAGNNATCAATDQRGVVRPLRIICDIGAFEGVVTIGGDPPIWGDIVAFPTPESALGRDLNGNGFIGDTVLRYQNLSTGKLTNTGLAVSNRRRDIDLYEDTVVFVEQTQYPQGIIYTYNLATSELTSTGVIGARPTLYDDIISVSGSHIRYYDLNARRLIETGIPGHAQAIWGRRIAYHRTLDHRFHATIRYYDIDTGEVINTRVAGQFPVIYENIIAFTTNESLIVQDLNGDGDINDIVIRYYDIETQKVTNTKQAGLYPAIFGDYIAFNSGHYVRYYDIQLGIAFDPGILGTEPDIFENTIAYYAWERWSGNDLNLDGDRRDPILGTFLIPDRAMPVEAPVPTLSERAQPLIVDVTLGYPNPTRTGEEVQFQAQGSGIMAIQVEVYDLAGRRLYDSGWVAGNALRWNLLNAQGQTVANGVYLYLITVRGENEQVRSKVQKLIVLR